MKRICLAIGCLAGLLAFLATGCSVSTPDNPKINVTQPEGREVAANFVAVGNSLTAGFMDGGLHIQGQINSVASLIGWRLGYLVQDPANADWTQPWVDEPGIGSSSTGNPALIASTLYWNGVTITFDTFSALEVQDKLLGVSLPTPYQNMAVPGATVSDVLTRLTSTTDTSGDVPAARTNPYFDFILRNPTFGDVTMDGQASSQVPTLITLWIGANDWLGGAMSGEPEVGVNVTPESVFETQYQALIDALNNNITARSGIKPTIVIGNVPGLTGVPYFITKALWDAQIGVIPMEEDPDVEYVLFPALPVVQDPGFTPPLGAEYTLDTSEVAVLNTEITAFNNHIASIASANGSELADTKALLESFAPPANTAPLFLFMQGLTPLEVSATTLFSNDGLHPNNRGNVEVANLFITAINTALGLEGSSGYGPLTAPISNWDPTYGRPQTKAGAVQVPSPEVMQQMGDIFR